MHLDYQSWNGPGSKLTQTPTTIASASTIVPTTKLTFLTGDTEINNITPPFDDFHDLYLVALDANIGFTNDGNIGNDGSVFRNFVTILTYNPINHKYYSIPS